MERRLNRRRFVNTELQIRQLQLLEQRLTEMKIRNAKLERVLGCTATSGCSLSLDGNRGLFAYPAGSTVVLCSGKTDKQAHLISPSKNSISCLAFSKDGCYLATGEGGHEPCVRVWELYDKSEQFTGCQIVELKGHQNGVACVRFSPDGSQIVSVGNQHDKSIAVWDWRNGKKSAENRLTSQVNAMDVSADGRAFVTVGVRHVKFWYCAPIRSQKPGAVGQPPPTAAPLQGRSAILSGQRNNTFVDVACGTEDRAYAITDTKLLVEFHDKKLVQTYDLSAAGAGPGLHALAYGLGHLYVGCDHGLIRVLALEPSLDQAMLVARPHYLGVDVAAGQMPQHMENHPPGARYPAVRALNFDPSTSRVTVIYADRSIYQWTLQSSSKTVVKNMSHLHHVGSIYGLEPYPAAVPCNYLPKGTFLTCGSDETVRFWNMDALNSSTDSQVLPRNNIYSPELIKVLYLGKSADSLCDPIEQRTLGGVAALPDAKLDSLTGVRSIRVSPNGQHLATGDRRGNLRVFDLSSPELPLIADHPAHESDVLCLEFSSCDTGPAYLLASGGRDRLIHIYDPMQKYEPLQTVDDHASAITAIKFIPDAEGLQMFTCASDRLVVIRRLAIEHSADIRFDRVNVISSNLGHFDMQVYENNLLMTACQDRSLRTYSNSGKLVATVKGSASEDGTLNKMCLDRSGRFAATVCSDKSVYVVDAATGDCMAVLSGQSDQVSAVCFTPDCRRLIVASFNGCVFVWRLSSHLTNKMHAKLRKSEQNAAAMERPTSPDSVLGSGSDGASDDASLATSRSAERGVADGAPIGKDSESEFGSLNSVRIGDDDENRVLDGQRQSVVVSEERTPEADGDGHFEIRRLSTEVIRRTASGMVRSPSNPWDGSTTGSMLGDHSDLDDDQSSYISTPSAQPNMSSRSMYNLRAASSVSTADRKQRRRGWGDSTGATSVAQQQDMSPVFERNAPQRVSITQRHHQRLSTDSTPDQQRRIQTGITGRPIWTPQGLQSSASSVGVVSENGASRRLGEGYGTMGNQLSNGKRASPHGAVRPHSIALCPSVVDAFLHGTSNRLQTGRREPNTSNCNRSNNVFNNNNNTFHRDPSNDFFNSHRDPSNVSKNTFHRDPSNDFFNSHRDPSNVSKNNNNNNNNNNTISHRDPSNVFNNNSQHDPSTVNLNSDRDPPNVPSKGVSYRDTGTSASALNARQRSADDYSSDNGTHVSVRVEAANRRWSTCPSSASGAAHRAPLARLRHRRAATLPASSSVTGSGAEGEFWGRIHRRGDDYRSSTLHLRSRSQSPSTLALNTVGQSSPNIRRDSDMSTGSTLTMRSTRLTPSSSRQNLRTIGGSNRPQSTQLNSRLSDVRDRLRKSQENLASVRNGNDYDDDGGGADYAGPMSRSKSIGHLGGGARYSTGSSHHRDDDDGDDRRFGRFDGAVTPTGTRGGMMSNALTRSRELAKSVGSLHGRRSGGGDGKNNNNNDEDQLMDYDGFSEPKPLSKTIQDLKRASNQDLSSPQQFDQGGELSDYSSDVMAQPIASRRGQQRPTSTDDYAESSPAVGGGYFNYSTASLPRRKGAVEKKVARYQPRFRTRFDQQYYQQQASASGESDSNASDANNSPIGTSRRYFQPSSPINARSISSVEVGGYPRPGTLQNARRLFEQPQQQQQQQQQQQYVNSGQVPAVPARRSSNYLANKMAGRSAHAEVVGGPDVGSTTSDDSPRSIGELAEFDSADKPPAAKQMARHIAECLEQFHTGLDKVLQAKQMLLADQRLCAEDKEKLLIILNNAIMQAKRRLDASALQQHRTEPEGRPKHHAQNYNNNQQNNLSPSVNPNFSRTSNNNIGNIGNNIIATSEASPQRVGQQTAQLDQLLQNAPQLIALLQEQLNMAKNN